MLASEVARYDVVEVCEVGLAVLLDCQRMADVGLGR